MENFGGNAIYFKRYSIGWVFFVFVFVITKCHVNVILKILFKVTWFHQRTEASGCWNILVVLRLCKVKTFSKYFFSNVIYCYKIGFT